MLKTVYLFLIIFAVQKLGHVLGVCGDDLKRYDDKTHDCVNGTLILRGSDDSHGHQLTTPLSPSSPNFLSCGKPPFVVKYDPNIEGCKNFTVFRLENTLPISKSLEKYTGLILTEKEDHANVESGPIPQINYGSVTTTEENVDRDSQRVINCRTEDDYLSCNGRVYCGKLDGYQCCGFDIYHPVNKTCCQTSSAVYRIHNVPASQYLCCDLQVHSRSSGSVPCQHPAANKAFFGTIKRLNYDSSLCLNIKYAHKIHFVKQQESTNQPYLRSFVTRYDLNLADQKFLKSRKAPKNIALDKYRRLRKTDRKDCVVFTVHDYMSDTVFYLRPGDMLFRAPNKKRLEKMLKKILNNCRRFNKRHLRGKI